MSDSEENHVFAVSQDLVPPAPIQLAGVSELDFDGLLAPPLQLHQDLRNGCGGTTCPAGILLAKYLLRQHRDALAGKVILELGAGCGLVGLAVALACTPQGALHVTDQAAMVPLLRQNIGLNRLDARVQPSVYDWGTPTPPHLPRHPDVILAAECVYYEPAFPLLLRTLQDLLGPHTVCYFCFKRRRRADLTFVKTARRLFRVDEVVDDPDKPTWSRDKLFL